jgi:hypothetical protein
MKRSVLHVKGFALLLIITSLFSGSDGLSQDIPIGMWREHLPYKNSISVAATDKLVYCATRHSLFYYHKSLLTMSSLSKVNGLSDVGFSKLAWHANTDNLLIAYSNANIDLLQDGKITNLSDIKRQNLPINKVINNITFHEDEAWLACGFGIVVINLVKKEFKETYIIGNQGSYININDIKFFNDTIYAATDAGIYRAALKDYLPDFTNWTLWTEIPYPLHTYNTLAFFNDMPFINLSNGGGQVDTLFYREQGQWKHYTKYGYEIIYQLDVFGDKLLMTKWDNVLVLDSQMEVYRIIFDYTAGFETVKQVTSMEAVIDEKGYVWIADAYQGLVFIYDQWAYKFIAPNGPGSKEAFHMYSSDNDLWIASGAYSSTWSMTFKRDGLFHYNGTEWRTVNGSTDPMIDSLFDFVCVAIDPSDPTKVYAGTWDRGLIFLKDGKAVKIYDQTNSSLSVLENNALGVYKVAIGGLTFDSKGNVWMTNAGVTKSLSVMRPDGTWISYDISSADMKMVDRVSGKIVIDRIGQKWVLLGRGYGLQVFNDNNTLYNTSDDKTANISSTTGRGALPSTVVTDIAIDLEGRLWIGSDKGIAVIYSPENVFSGYSYDAQQILVNQDGYDNYLLENEIVTAIAVDGGNRKWVGTEQSGVFLLSPDGTREIARFHEGNSPLLSNGIRGIDINQVTGEVFFATDKGIISFRSDATRANETHEHIKVFPNPVHPDYTGAIAISGLVRDADVKITSVGGDVVFSTRANGGEAVWYGKDHSGNRVATGVYLVFSSDAQGMETAVAKILFIR